MKLSHIGVALEFPRHDCSEPDVEDDEDDASKRSWVANVPYSVSVCVCVIVCVHVRVYAVTEPMRSVNKLCTW